MGAAVTKSGDAGKDRLFGTAGRDIISGAGGDDIIVGRGGNDLICAGGGADLVFGGAKNDRIKGGGGFDVISFYTPSARSGVIVNLAARRSQGEGVDRWTSVEGAAGSAGADVMKGTRKADLLLGNPGNDVLRGSAGADNLLGLEGDDRYEGGRGNDLGSFYFYDGERKVTADLATGRANGEGHDTLESIENLEAGENDGTYSFLDFVLRGDNRPNILLGGPGEDELWGEGGNDLFFGGGETDFMIGGDGDDYGRSGGNRIAEYWEGTHFYGGNGDDVFVGREDGDFAAGGAGKDRLYGRGHYDRLAGNEGHDLIVGGPFGDALGFMHTTATYDPGNDRYFGNGGHDEIDGDPGDDFISGGPGSDDLQGGAGEDLVTFRDSSHRVTVDLIGAWARGQGKDEFTDYDVENVEGSSFGDRITGHAGPNTLLGRSGDDTIGGGDENDFLDGGGGFDALNGNFGIDTCENGEEEEDCELPIMGPISRKFGGRTGSGDLQYRHPVRGVPEADFRLQVVKLAGLDVLTKGLAHLEPFESRSRD